MKNFIIGIPIVVFLSSYAQGSVTIAGWEENDCPSSDYDLIKRCPNQKENLCCAFDSRNGATWSVGWDGLEQGSVATWYKGRQTTNCAGRRVNQVQMGEHQGRLCMTAGDGEHSSHDGATWSAPEKPIKMAAPKVTYADPGSLDIFMGIKLPNLVSGVARRDSNVNETNSVCIGNRYSKMSAHDKRGDGNGLWVLNGTAENHKRFEAISDANPSLPAAERLSLAGATFYEHWEHDPVTRAVKRGEPSPSLPTLAEMINTGEVDDNLATRQLAREELMGRSIELTGKGGPQEEDKSTETTAIRPSRRASRRAIQSIAEANEDISTLTERDAHDSIEEDSFPWIAGRSNSEVDEDLYPTQDKRAPTEGPDDSFPWITGRSDSEIDEDSFPIQEKRDNAEGPDDSFPWITGRSDSEIDEDSFPIQEKRDNAEGPDDSFPWITGRSDSEIDEDSFPIQEKRDNAEGPDDSFPWITGRSNSEVDEDLYPTQDKRRSVEGPDDSFPWIDTRDESDETHDLEERDTADKKGGEIDDSFPWIA